MGNWIWAAILTIVIHFQDYSKILSNLRGHYCKENVIDLQGPYMFSSNLGCISRTHRFTHATLASASISRRHVSVRPSVCPSVTSRCSAKTAKSRITQTTIAHTIAQRLYLSDTENLGKIQTSSQHPTTRTAEIKTILFLHFCRTFPYSQYAAK